MTTAEERALLEQFELRQRAHASRAAGDEQSDGTPNTERELGWNETNIEKTAERPNRTPNEKLPPVTVAVVRDALDKLGISVRFNLMTGRMEIAGMPEQFSLENAANTLPTLLVDYLKVQGCRCSRVSMGDYLNMIADENRYNPVADMLNSIVWDEKDRIERICEIMGIEPYTDAHTYLLKWMIQCVALALNDEANPIGGDGVLVLQGDQGIGKTRVISVLSIDPKWFCEGATVNVDDKDSIMRATSAWITELGELDFTFKKEQAALKAFLTASVDQYRPPYGQSIVTRPRRTSFAATVNPYDFLRDDTGSRRYWVIHITAIDLDALHSLTREWLEQLWAQIYKFYQVNPSGFRLTKAERATLAERNR